MSGALVSQIGIDSDAAVHRQARLFGERQARPHADADDHDIGFERAAALERGAAAVERRHGFTKMKDDAVLLVQRANEIAELRPEHALHRPRFRRHDMDLDIAGAQRRRRFEPDEARADDQHALARFRCRR